MKFNDLRVGMFIAEVFFKDRENMSTKYILMEILGIEGYIATISIIIYLEINGVYKVEQSNTRRQGPNHFGLSVPIDDLSSDDKAAFIKARFEAISK